MTSPLSGFVDRALDRVARAFRDATTGAREVVGAPLRPDLPDDELPRLRRQIDVCLSGPGGETAARVRAAELGRTYLGLSADGRRKFLTILARDHGPDADAITAAITRWQEAADDRGKAAAEAALRRALESPAAQLLARFNSLPEGVKFVVDLRAELLRMGRKDPAIARLAEDLRRLLSTWFDVGFLDLRHIDWGAPAALLEKLIAYEAVHAIGSWSDLKNRLDSDRRCFAYFHPRMPDEPLIFVEVALVDGMADNVQRLLDESAPTRDPRAANTAIFYSISNCQPGLARVSFGNYLIKRVAEDLKRELPKLGIFATLSPIPGFGTWLDSILEAQGDAALLPTECEALAAVTDAAHGAAAVKLLLADSAWPTVRAHEQVLKPILMRLCACYLVRETRAGKALDRVAHFHLGNGARIERLNWLGDPSPNGLKQACGLMVNYRYKLEDVDANHEAYADGKIVASNDVKRLAKT
ncbi:malonyl-CoA decarboxylase [Vineibacter terrae]|uniref:Malonyl-CoA decarboxylase n=1 Tax=Vineibacter terrae TaxID=2586908 RepID=A0A5C8PMI3_9HYPH|nr:malonyl-CoA decarboxylase family protein [Vineibacter terrae]TXL74806.1 malonyl-CoA decarboxylase [Vineibacter terrae]